MNLTALIIQLIAGALGGNAAGAASKDLSLGPLGNSIAGALGGGVGGQILNAILGIGGTGSGFWPGYWLSGVGLRDGRRQRWCHRPRSRLPQVEDGWLERRALLPVRAVG